MVSASARGLDFMVKHRIKGLIGGGAATMAERSINAYQEVSERARLSYKLGEGLTLGISFHLAETRERAVREITPWYEERVKMFGPLGFVPGPDAGAEHRGHGARRLGCGRRADRRALRQGRGQGRDLVRGSARGVRACLHPLKAAKHLLELKM